MQLSQDTIGTPVQRADPTAVDVKVLHAQLEAQIEGEVRFDNIARALYSTDASVYQIEPLGVVIVRSRQDVVRTIQLCARHRCPVTVRGGGTSQAGQAIGPGLQMDTSKYLNRVLEVNPSQRWARVEPGVVLDELNRQLRRYGLMFAPDVSTSNRATIGGMMANNSSGAHSVIYGKTIDHVLEQHVVLSDGSEAHLKPLTSGEVKGLCAGQSLESRGCQVVHDLAVLHKEEVNRRFPKILRRVGGYNLEAFVEPKQPFNLCNLMVGSEGTLGVVTEAKVKLVELPKAKALMVIHFSELLKALEATPFILKHDPSAVEVMDAFILDHTRQNPSFDRLRDFIEGDPGALLLVEFFGEDVESLGPRLSALEGDLRQQKFGYHYHYALDLGEQAEIWALRKACLGLSMAMKGDAKALSFVEDTAVDPVKLRDYIDRFLKIVDKHGTTAGVYAHASVGCLHVRPVINLKTEEGVGRFEAIAHEVADLVLEYGGAVSGEHGDGLVRSPFTRKMFGSNLYDAFRTIKRTFDPLGILNPGKIVDAPPLTANLRYGTLYQTADPPTFFDYSEHGGWGRAVEMCSGVGACRKKFQGTMCPSYMATRDEAHSTRGRANVLRLAMSGQLGEVDLQDRALREVLDLCLECRACKSECPVGVDMARFKSEFLADYWSRHGTPLSARMLGNIQQLSRWSSPLAPFSNWMLSSGPVRWLNERVFGIDARRQLPQWQKQTLSQWWNCRTGSPSSSVGPQKAVLFKDTFTNYFEPEIGIAAIELCEAAGIRIGLAPNHCCGRPLISQGMLNQAREYARKNVQSLFPVVQKGLKVVVCEPSCLSALCEDAPALLRGEEQEKAKAIAESCLLFEEFMEMASRSGNGDLSFISGPSKILLHGHCHQKAMGRVAPAQALLSRIPDCRVVDLDAGCCGMAGSFGYMKAHYDVSCQIAERQLLPAVREKDSETVVVASGTSCRHQVRDLSGESALHPALLLRSLLRGQG